MSQSSNSPLWGGACPTSSITVRRSDLPRGEQQQLVESVRYLLQRHFAAAKTEAAASKPNKKGKRKVADSSAAHGQVGDPRAAASQLVGTLKMFLERQHGGVWHCAMGADMGYALKYRKGSLCLLSVGRDEANGAAGCLLLVYRSPGFEIVTPDVTAEGRASLVAPQVGGAKVTFEDVVVVENHKALSHQATRVVRSAVAEAMAAVDTPDVDVVRLSQLIRRRLTGVLGPIWHVIAGEEWEAAVADKECFRLSFTIPSRQGKRVCVLVFRHELAEATLAKKLFDTLPYLFMAFLCFGLLFRGRICGSDSTQALFKAWGHTGGRAYDVACSDNTGSLFLYSATLAMVGSVGWKLMKTRRP